MRDFSRQNQILDAADVRLYPITIIGAGTIGSWTALALAKAGFDRLRVFDPDRVGTENELSQLYGASHVGLSKVAALRVIIKSLTGVTLTIKPRAYSADDNPSGIVIAAVDSMAARKMIWGTVVNNPAVPLFLDGRMAGESGRVYAVQPVHPHEITFYESPRVLYTDEEASDLPCGARGIVYNGFIIGALLCYQLRVFLCGGSVPSEIVFDLVSQSWFYRDHRGGVITATHHRKESC